jgi:hypothetical protein
MMTVALLMENASASQALGPYKIVLVSQKSFPKLAKAGRGRLFKTVQTAELIPTKVLGWPWPLAPGAVLGGPLE